jgi:hypothetical protein
MIGLACGGWSRPLPPAPTSSEPLPATRSLGLGDIFICWRPIRCFRGVSAQVATVAEKVRKQVARFARPAIVGTLTGSAGMNAFAFAAQTVNPWMIAAAVALGVAIPALIYALMRAGTQLRSPSRA